LLGGHLFECTHTMLYLAIPHSLTSNSEGWTKLLGFSIKSQNHTNRKQTPVLKRDNLLY